MGRFLLTTWPGGGSVPPTLNLGVRLVRRGHDVLVVGWDAMAAQVEGRGLRFAGCPSVPPWPDALPFDDDLDRLDAQLHGSGAEEDILRAAAGFGPDVLVIDCMMAAAFRAATRVGTRSAILSHLLYGNLAANVDKIAPGVSLAAADLVLALTPPGFEADPALPANTAYVGPICHPDRAAAGGLGPLDGPGDPWVLLSLSTTEMRQRDALPPLLDALGPLPVRVLLTLGGIVDPEAVTAPANVTVRGFVPHDAVLPRMAAVLTHGGLTTITTALAYGVPLLVVPQGRDQHLNAARVVASGTGRTVGEPAEVADALTGLLADPTYAEAARRLAAEIDRLGYGERATDLVAALATSSSR